MYRESGKVDPRRDKFHTKYFFLHEAANFFVAVKFLARERKEIILEANTAACADLCILAAVYMWVYFRGNQERGAIVRAGDLDLFLPICVCMMQIDACLRFRVGIKAEKRGVYGAALFYQPTHAA